MAKRSPVHVEPRQKGWAVVREGNERATSVHPTQADAAKVGRDIARRDETEFFLHAQDGRIREHNIFGEGGAAEKGGEMSESQNLVQQIREQTVKSAQDFYGESLGRLKSQLQNDRAQLESLAEQVPDEEAQAEIQELVDSYEAIESSLDQSAQDLGVAETVSQALQQAQEAVGQVAGQAQEAVGGAAQQAQDTAGQAVQGAQSAAKQAAGQAQEAAGQTTQQVQEVVGGSGQEEPDATQAARQKAEELGVDLSQVEGSGTGGRITIRDVQRAANQG